MGRTNFNNWVSLLLLHQKQKEKTKQSWGSIIANFYFASDNGGRGICLVSA